MNEEQQSDDAKPDTSHLRPTLPSKAAQGERGDETITTARLHSREKDKAIDKKEEDSSNAPDEAVPPITLT